MTKWLSAVDAAYLRIERRGTPMHGGQLMVFRKPDGAPADWATSVFAELQRAPISRPPFNWRLVRRFGRPAWQIDPAPAPDHHIRFWTLPGSGGWGALHDLVLDLHTQLLDPARPLWECHMIDGLGDDRFAIYFRVHHAPMDGAGFLAFLHRWLTADRSRVDEAAPWSESPAGAEPVTGERRGVMARLAGRIGQGLAIPEAVYGYARARASSERVGGGLIGMLDVPRSTVNASVSTARSLVVHAFDLARLKAVSRAADVTINDVALAIIGHALRRHLMLSGGLPGQSLVASIPVALPRRDGLAGNVGTAIFCRLGTDHDDGLKRLAQIHRATTQAKAILNDLSPSAIQNFTRRAMRRLMAIQARGWRKRSRPFFNVAVSNVVFSRNPLYLKGARLETSYPVSLLFEGYALNITIVGLVDRVTIGITACPDAFPRAAGMADLLDEGLALLEHSVFGPVAKTATA